MEKTQFLVKVYLSILFIVVAFFFYYGVFNVFGIIIDEFVSTLRLMPIIIMCFLPLFYLANIYFNLYHKAFSKKFIISFLIIVLTLKLISLVLLGLNYEYYFLNPTSAASTIIYFFSLAFLTSFDIFLIFNFKKDYPSKFNITSLPNLSFNVKRWWLIFYYMCTSFFLVSALIGLINHNFTLDFMNYLFIILLCIIPLLNLLNYIVYFNSNKDRIKRIIMLVIDSSFLLALVLVSSSNYNMFISLAQHLFLLDFAASMPISQIVLMLLLIVPILELSFKELYMFLRKKEN